MIDISLDLILMLSGAAFAAGFVDSIAGGGGLISLPALLLAGATPLQALSTNKVQGVFGAATAAISYAMAGHVDPRRQIGAALLAALAGAMGALLISVLPTGGLRLVLPVVLIAIAAFFAFRPGLSDEDSVARLSPGLFRVLIVPLIACYDGLVGPGTGSFFVIAFVTLGGYGVLRATAHTKLLNFASNLGSLIGFASMGAPLWGLGLAMGLAQVLGARLGSRLAMRSGARLIRPLLVVTSSAMAAKLIWGLIRG